MIDIHSHILFGVDDGAQTEDDTLKLLKESYAQGVRKIIATPHQRKNMFEEPLEKLEKTFEKVKELALKIADDLEIYLGCEIYYSQGVEVKIEQNLLPTLANTDYLLIEFNYKMSYKDMYKALNKVILLGTIPVIAHIERYDCLENNINRIGELKDLGCLMQVNSSSILKPKLFGDRHKTYKKRAKVFLEKNIVDFIASDMHNITNRKPYMKEAYVIIKEKYGKERAEKLFKKNQEKLLENKII